jgi:DNA replication and repair protein RecF
MHLQSLTIQNFKNLVDYQLEFSDKINCIVGENGVGKTNLLDAIYYLCLTKSVLGHTDSACIFKNDTFFRLRGFFEYNKDKFEVIAAYSSTGKKIFTVNDSEYEKMSLHIGKFPLVMIAPDDTDLIREGSELRRKFFDTILCQFNQEYLAQLMLYNHVLKQRNSLLKQSAETGKVDAKLFEIYDSKLIVLGQYIFEERKKFTYGFMPVFKKVYKQISLAKEEPSLNYISDFQENDLNQLFKKSFEKDLILARTTKGIHTDEYEFELDGASVKKIASQGQRKTYIIALKLAQYDALKNEKNIKPLLLLDDIFDKLDDERIEQMIRIVSEDNYGQIFISDARPERSKSFFSKSSFKAKFFELTKQ